MESNISTTKKQPGLGTTEHPGILRRLTSFEADVVTAIIGGMVLLIAVLLAFCAWKKRQAEKRHKLHKLQGQSNKSLSGTTGLTDTNTLVQRVLLYRDRPICTTNLTPNPQGHSAHDEHRAAAPLNAPSGSKAGGPHHHLGDTDPNAITQL